MSRNTIMVVMGGFTQGLIEATLKRDISESKPYFAALGDILSLRTDRSVLSRPYGLE